MHCGSAATIWAGFALILAGCSGAGLEPTPRSDIGAITPAEGWKSGGLPGEVGSGWIADFKDPPLAALVAEGLKNNPDILLASANLESAQAVAKRAGAALLPAANLNAGGSRNLPFEGTSTASLGVSLDVSWELDIWGRAASAKRGAGMQFEASMADYAFARQSLAAQIAKSWFLAVESKVQRDLAVEFVENYTGTLKIVQARFDAGAVTQQDLSNARADLASSQQAAQAAETAYREALRSLEVLVGRYPSAELSVADGLQAVPPPIPAGLPSEILERRPDVMAAERQVAAAFQFSKSAAAARLPRISLTAGAGSASNALSSLVNPASAAASLGAGLFQPLFDGGVKQSEFDQARANQKAAIARYQNVALRAFQEVENALDRESSLRGQEEQLRDAASNYEQARKIAEMRYKKGAVSLNEVLVTQRQEMQSKAALVQVRGARLVQRTNLHLALGGNFEKGTADPHPASGHPKP